VVQRGLGWAAKLGMMGGRAIRQDWTKVLRRGDQALRARLAKSGSARFGPSVQSNALRDAEPEIGVASDVLTDAAVLPALDATGTTVPPAPTDAVSTVAAPLARLDDANGEEVSTPAVAGPLPNVFAQLTVGDRITQPLFYRDRTLMFAALLVIGMALSGAVATLRFSAVPAEEPASSEDEKRGQVEKSETITVELVEAPDGASRSKVSKEGEDAPAAAPPPVEPTEAAPPGPPEPEERQAEAARKPEQKAEAPVQKPLTVDDFDVSMADYAKAVDEAQAERQRRKTQPVRSAQASRIAGAAPEGKQSAYVKAVLAVVAKNKPQLYISKGEVYVQFVLTRGGQIGALKVIETSGDPLLDQIAVNAIKVLKFPAPPVDVSPNDLNYVIHYVMR